MTTIGIIGMILGAGSSAWGAQLQTQTIQFAGNPRIQAGTVISFLGGVTLSVSGISLFLTVLF